MISRVGIAMKGVSLLSHLPMTEGRQENSNGLLFGMRIMRLWTDRSSRAVAHLDLGAPGPLGKSRVPQCKIERETSSQMPMPKRFPRRSIATQSQCTYTWWTKEQRFRQLPDRSHGVFFESELFRANFPLRKGHVVEPDDDEELFQKYYFMEGGPGKKNH